MKKIKEYWAKNPRKIKLLVLGMAVATMSFSFGICALAQPSECNDGVDNDMDGLIDMDELTCMAGASSESVASLGLQSGDQYNGWTVYDPPSGAQIIYVSSSLGNDANDCLSPATACQTLGRGHDLLQNHSSDWLMLKRGDSWDASIGDGLPDLGYWRKYGASIENPIVVTSYGPGNIRPRANKVLGPASNTSFIGIHLEPASGNASGVVFAVHSTLHKDNVLFEDVYMARTSDNVNLQFLYDNFRVRRSVIVDAYGGRSQGIYAYGVDRFLLEENVIDHNGWYEPAGALPTIFNHNVYTKATTNAIVRGNILSRASSFGFTGSPMIDGLVTNNLFLANGNSMTFGADDPLIPNRNLTISDNVLTRMGRNINGSLQSYGIDVRDSVGLRILNNYLVDKPFGGTTFSIRLNDVHNDSIVQDNVVYGWLGGDEPIDNTTSASGVVLSPNKINLPESSFADPTRTIDSYAQSIGLADMDAFILAARNQSRFNWNSLYTASAANDYIKAGFVTAEFRADVDGSLGINTTDALLTLRNSLRLSMNGTAWRASATTGDVNCDGVSNSTDALLILRHSLGLSMSGTGWCE